MRNLKQSLLFKLYVCNYVHIYNVCMPTSCMQTCSIFFIEASFILLCIHFLYWIRTLSGFNIRPDITATSKSRSITKNINGWFTDICVGCAWAPALPANKNNNEKKCYYKNVMYRKKVSMMIHKKEIQLTFAIRTTFG